MNLREVTRLSACKQAVAMIADGLTVSASAEKLGVSLGTLERWLRKYRTDGQDGLTDNYHAVGRPAIADDIPPEFVDFIRRKTAMCGSATLAYRFAADDENCPTELQNYLIEKKLSGKPITLPGSLRRVANVTPELAARRKSDVEYGHVAFKGRHDRTVIDPITGQRRGLLAGDVYQSDDMSTNHPFWFELSPGEVETRAGRGDKLAERLGVAVGRQGLYTMDSSGKWLGFDLIGSAADAYSAADVLRHFRHVLAEHGMPRLGWVLERGVWMSRSVDGTIAANIDDNAKEEMVAGLSSLGFNVTHVRTSEGKGIIEGGFGYYQAICDLMEAPTVGRNRGEMRRVEREMTRIRAGIIHPSDIGIPHITEHRTLSQKAQVFFNSQCKNGKIQTGVPDVVWTRDTTTHPLRALAASDRGVFMPEKSETKFYQGGVQKRINGVTYRFAVPELAGRLGDGYHVRIAFDPGNPTDGAEIYNLETGARNVDGYKFGAWMGHAEYSADMPLFGYSPEVGTHRSNKKTFNRSFTAAHAGTGLFGKGAGISTERRERDGSIIRIESNLGGGVPSADQDLSSGTLAPGVSPASIRASRRIEMDEVSVNRMSAAASDIEAKLLARGEFLTVFQ